MSHPDDVRYCNPCGILFFDKRALQQHRIRAHDAEPPCHRLAQEKWCDHSGLGGFMGHTCGAIMVRAARHGD
jgi:hypothetical protein